jgi:hypothetical protein
MVADLESSLNGYMEKLVQLERKYELDTLVSSPGLNAVIIGRETPRSRLSKVALRCLSSKLTFNQPPSPPAGFILAAIILIPVIIFMCILMCLCPGTPASGTIAKDTKVAQPTKVTPKAKEAAPADDENETAADAEVSGGDRKSPSKARKRAKATM